MTEAQPVAVVPDLVEPERRISRAALLALWVAAGVTMVAFIGRPPLVRTQEARVLETGREMLDQGWRAWVLPKCNDQYRLRKPPVPYWMAAGSYKALKVNEFAGRLPFALMAWLLLAVTYSAGRAMFGQRAGLLAAAGLAGSFMFVRYMPLAETDGPAALGVTFAIHALWRAMEPGVTSVRRGLWFHAAAAGAAFAGMTKGLPALFPVGFGVAWALLAGRPRMLWDFARSGAWATAALLVAPWFVYVALTPEARQFREALGLVLGGLDHPGPFIRYVPELLGGVLPWSPLVVLGLIAGIMGCKSDLRHRALVVWCGAIFLPLCVIGNKQPHYLLPLLPPLFILMGGLLQRALSEPGRGGDPEALRWSSLLFRLMLAASPLAGVGIIVGAMVERADVRLGDAALAAAALVGAGLVFLLWRNRGLAGGLGGYAAVAAGLMPVVVSLWMPTLPEVHMRDVAARLRKDFGAGPFCQYGPDADLVLVYELRTIIRAYRTEAQLLAATAGGDWVVIVQDRKHKAPLPAPKGFAEVLSLPGPDRQAFRIYRHEPPAAASSMD